MRALIAANMPAAHVFERGIVVTVGAKGIGFGEFSTGRREIEQFEPVQRAFPLKVSPDIRVCGVREIVAVLKRTKKLRLKRIIKKIHRKLDNRAVAGASLSIAHISGIFHTC
jgi:hypothetical protein